MAGRRKTRDTLITAAIFILLEVAAIAILRISDSEQSIWLNKASYETKAWLWGKSEAVNKYFRLSKKNKWLEEQNAILWNELRKYKKLEEEGEIHSLDSLDEHFDSKLAKVIKLSTNSQKNYFILDKGFSDGIVEKSGVITPNGVVGIVETVNKNISSGRTIMNSGMSISARLGRHGLVGSLTWDGKTSNGAILHGIPLYYDVQVKDTVWTSGFSSMFPSGIALGIVTGSTIQNGSTKDINVNLFQDMNSIEYVFVIVEKKDYFNE